MYQKALLKAFLISLLLGTSAVANEKASQPQENITVSKKTEDVKDFVSAALQISAIKMDIQKRLQDQSNGQKPSKAVLDQASAEFAKRAQTAIKNNGLDMQEYSRYAQLLQKDQQFQTRVKELAKEMTTQ